MMYTIEAIVLKKHRINDNKIIYTCFSREYGKIDIFFTEKKQTLRLDTLSHFTGKIITKDKNTLSQIYSLSPFSPKDTYEIYEIA